MLNLASFSLSIYPIFDYSRNQTTTRPQSDRNQKQHCDALHSITKGGHCNTSI